MGNTWIKKLDWTRCIDETDIEMANATTCHGMARMYLIGGVVRRSIWVCIVMLVVAVCLWQATERFKTFLKFELKTDVSITYTTKMEFPAVTICNLNSFSARALDDLDRALFNNVSFDLAREIRSITANYKDSPNLRELIADVLAKYDVKERKLLDSFGKPSFATDRWLDEKSWQLRDEILICSFAGDECKAKDFEVSYTRAGRCYTFRAFQNKTRPVQTIPGSDGGLSLYINIEQDDYSPYSLLGDYQSEAGVKVIVQPPYEPPDANIGVSTMPGYTAFVPVRLTTMEGINNKPWMECSSGSGEMPTPFDTYTVKSCQTMCEAKIHVEQCGCKPWFIQGYPNEKVCGIARTTYCQSWEIDEADRANCVSQCLPACTTQEYNFQATYAQLPSFASVEKLNANLFGANMTRGNLTIDELRQNWLHVVVYFDEFLYVTRSSSEAYPYGSFLADMGGQFNLFCGFSVITGFEMIEYVLVKFYRRLRGYLRRRKAKKSASKLSHQHHEAPAKQQRKEDAAIINAGRTMIIGRLAALVGENIDNRRQSLGLPPAPLPEIVQRAISINAESAIVTQPKPLFAAHNKRLGRDLGKIVGANLNRRRARLNRLAPVVEEPPRQGIRRGSIYATPNNSSYSNESGDEDSANPYGET